ncbi:MAG TPA: PQQ-binding-like beta-propeller repeat protein [Vicinamibacteria bacterium]|nr:PQQ-binding-like beta-propeller repeat protein [Vicinamibacteria bacterium]
MLARRSTGEGDMKKTMAAALLVAGMATSAAATGADWPGLRGPNHDGSAEAGARFADLDGALAVRWRVRLGSGYSGIAVSGGRAVTMFADGDHDVLAALDVESGREAWRVVLGQTHPGLDGSYDGPISTPVLDGGRAFALGPRGHLVAVDLASGRELWRADLRQRDGARPPHYGMASSPVVAGGVLVLEVGSDQGRAVAGFDLATGARRWSLGDDAVQYQSPALVRVGGRELVAAVGDRKLFLVDPATGQLAAEHGHGGEPGPIGVASAVPLPAGEGRLFLKTHNDRSTMFALRPAPEGRVSVETLWTAPVLRTTYSLPVYHDGHLYGMNGRTVLTCVRADTGEVVWRSREPGDGFLALVGGDLVVLAKARTLHVGAASPKGWTEKARLELFEDVAWTPPSFAAGTVFARGNRDVARVEWRSARVEAGAAEAAASPPRFGAFLAEVETSADKAAVVDRFLATVPGGPLVEWPDHVVFLYRGEAADVGIATDLIGMRREDPMRRVPGTDLFYYQARVDPDVRVNYQFVRNYEEPLPDPRNPRQVPAAFGPVPASSLAMPAWREPAHLAPAAGTAGRLEAHEVMAASRPGAKVALHVYLPRGYPAGAGRYPVAYVLGGDAAREQGLVARSLDALIPGRVAAAMIVFVGRADWGEDRPAREDASAAFLEMLVKDVVPFVDGRYATDARPAARAIVGHSWEAQDAVRAAFAEHALFGGLAVQSLTMLDTDEAALRAVVRTAEERPLRIYQDWGRYDHHGTRENWDMRTANRRFREFLREKGHRLAGGEAPDGAGWASWRNRTDKVFEALFPAATP